MPDFLSYFKKIWQEKQEKSILPRCSHAPKRLMMFGWCPSLQRTSSSPAKSLWSSLEAYSGKKVKSRDPFLWCLIRNNCTPWSPSPSSTLSCHWVWKTLAKSKRWLYHRGLAVHILGQCFLWLGAVLWQGGCLAAPLTWPTRPGAQPKMYPDHQVSPLETKSPLFENHCWSPQISREMVWLRWSCVHSQTLAFQRQIHQGITPKF